jgi:CBS domain containing-hemolysin-like protein
MQIDGAMSPQQFNAQFAHQAELYLDASEFETVGGLLLHELGELPEVGTGIVINDLVFTVQALEGNRIQTLSVAKRQPEHVHATPQAQANAQADGSSDGL